MSENFSDYLIDILNKGSLSLMLSVGHRTKLFDILSDMSPATSEEIAAKSGLNSRYVKEWLGAMVTGKIIDYDPTKKNFHLSKEKAQYLTSQNSVYDFSASMQWIPILAQVEDEIVRCFRVGGGVPYSSYKRFHDVMAEESYQTVVVGLLEHIIPLVTGLDARLRSGISVLDVGCGRGRAINLLAAHYPKSKFTGYDLSAEAIKNAALYSKSMNNENVSFEVQNLMTVPPSVKFDLITAFDVIHDQINPQMALNFIFDSLKDGGIFLMQDILSSTELNDNRSHPLGSFLYTISCLHCMSVSLSQNGAGLGAMWGKEKALELLRNAGFTNISVNTLKHDFQNYYYVCKKQ